MVVLMAGLPGTGKSTLARALAGEMESVVLSKDTIRAELFADKFVEYSTEQDDFVQGVMEMTAAYLLARHPTLTVFLDGRTFSKSYQIERVIAVAERAGTPWRIIECVCAEEIAKARIQSARRHPAKNRTVELYERVRERFEAITRPKLVVDTGGATTAPLAPVLEYLKG